MQKECVAFYDGNRRLNVWPLSACNQYDVGLHGTVCERFGCYVLMPVFASDGLAVCLTNAQACELIAAAGILPPEELLESICSHQTRQFENPKNERKRRSKPRRVPASRGLAEFTRKRFADSRGMHDRHLPDSLPTHEGDH